MMMTRRTALAGAAALFGNLRAATPGPLVETHVHLFDPQRAPYAPDTPYQPATYTLEAHVKMAQAAGMAHSIIVHPEPYQDDHRYLEYCFGHEPSPGFFKGTCLFDPLRAETPRRVRGLVESWPRRILAMRIHAVSRTVESAGPIRNRDMTAPAMRECWKALSDLGVGIQMHFFRHRPRIFAR